MWSSCAPKYILMIWALSSRHSVRAGDGDESEQHRLAVCSCARVGGGQCSQLELMKCAGTDLSGSLDCKAD